MPIPSASTPPVNRPDPVHPTNRSFSIRCRIHPGHFVERYSLESEFEPKRVELYGERARRSRNRRILYFQMCLAGCSAQYLPKSKGGSGGTLGMNPMGGKVLFRTVATLLTEYQYLQDEASQFCDPNDRRPSFGRKVANEPTEIRADERNSAACTQRRSRRSLHLL
jgi:hypothetical protein